MYALEELGWSDQLTTDFEPHFAEGLAPARVAVQHRGAYVLYSALGELRATVAGRLEHVAAGAGELPAVGDWVAVAARPDEGAATIQAVLPRRTKFSRKVTLGAAEEQVLAANIDTVFLLSSLNEDLNLRRLERYLAMAWESGAQPVIVLTKTDLSDDVAGQTLQVESVAYGVPVHPISSITGDGLALVRSYLAPGQNRRAARLVRCRQVDPRQHARRRGASRSERDPRVGRRGPSHHHLPAARPPPGGRPRARYAWTARDSVVGVGRRPRRDVRRHRGARGAVSLLGLRARHRARLRHPGGPRQRHARRRALDELQEAPARARAPRAPARQAPAVRGAQALDTGRRRGARANAREAQGGR